MPSSPRRSAAGGPACDHTAFTLVELLAVIAVLAVLAGILVPTLGAARASALKAQTRVQFAQWIAALEQFRQEYGCYPPVGSGGKLATAADALQFVRTLSGRNPDGSGVTAAADLNGNFRRLSLCAFAGADFLDPDGPDGSADYSGNELLRDAFGNTEIGVLVDRNGDGFIKPADDGPLVAVRGAAGTAGLAPDETDLPATGIRAGVAFYSAGRGAIPADMVFSWK
ncbi:MAG: type II secretion system protein [Opitutaceae bacterium]|nr:type II secretion system protein [Opitutaceae bacterium]